MIMSENGLCAFHAGFPARAQFADALDTAHSKTAEEKSQILEAIASITDTSPERTECHPLNLPLDDIVWSDIDPNLDDLADGPLTGYNRRGPNGSPGPGIAWGHRAFERFCEITRSTIAIRGHQHSPPDHSDVERLRTGAWRYKNCVTIDSSIKGGTFVSLELSIENPTPRDLKYHTPLMEV